MRCPFCSSDDTRVVDSRPSADGAVIRRRRECPQCGNRFTTYERMELGVVTVVKRDGRREPFDPFKVRRGVEAALADRPIDPGAVDHLVQRVQAEVSLTGPVISADQLGHLVLGALRDLDEVAYLRFASVYKEFQGARDFEREMAALEDG